MIKVVLKDIGGGRIDLINLTEYRNRWRTRVNTIFNLWGS